MAFWLMKSEPSAYSWPQFVKDKRTAWSGVRNHQAANNLRAMKAGDQALFYHSNEGVEIVGLMRIVKTAYPDPSDASGKFVMVDVAPVRALKKPVTLVAIKADPILKSMAMVKQSRLSVSPVTEKEWRRVQELAGAD
ncbi:MAG: EVE domain-containing protein [Alphaproteobacteria bacterium]